MQKTSVFQKYVLGGKEYEIRFKKPNIGEQLKISQMTAALKGGFPALDGVGENLAFKVATLNVVILDKPADLDFMALDVDDWDVIFKMFEDYEKFAFFRGENKQEANKS